MTCHHPPPFPLALLLLLIPLPVLAAGCRLEPEPAREIDRTEMGWRDDHRAGDGDGDERGDETYGARRVRGVEKSWELRRP